MGKTKGIGRIRLCQNAVAKLTERTASSAKTQVFWGSTVCRYHGGASKHVKAAARARIENATDRLAKELLGMAIDPAMAPPVKLAAIKDALDRGGLKAPNEVVLSQGSSPYEEIFDEIAAGPRDESRAARGYDSIPNTVDSHDDSPAYGYPAPGDPTPAPATPPSAPRSTETDERRRRDRSPHRSAHITGEATYQVANATAAAMGTLRALPPGRGG